MERVREAEGVVELSLVEDEEALEELPADPVSQAVHADQVSVKVLGRDGPVSLEVGAGRLPRPFCRLFCRPSG